ncbi:unnamed protein product, partial [Owenia fusiformis]
AVPGTSKEEEGGGDKPKEMVTFKVVYNKQKQDVTYDLDSTILDLKKSIETKIGMFYYRVQYTCTCNSRVARQGVSNSSQSEHAISYNCIALYNQHYNPTKVIFRFL